MNARPPAKPGLWSRLFYGIRVFLAAGAFLGFGLGAPLLVPAFALAWLWGGTPLEKRKRCQRIVGGSFRFFHAYMSLMGLIKYRPELQLPPSDGPRILVANHPSLIDTTALVAAHPEVCCVVKSGIYNSPLFFLLMKFCGHIRVNRDSRDSGLLAIEAASTRLEEGSDVLFFPEGTRSRGGDVGDFRPGAFAVAVLGGFPITPVAIFCSGPVLKRGTPWYQIPPEPVSLTLEPLGEVTPLENETTSELKNRVHSILQTRLQEHALHPTHAS